MSTADLIAAASAGSLPDVRAAIGQASQSDINAALALAVTKEHDEVFDFLLARADASVFNHQPLRNAVEVQNLHALRRLLPAPDDTLADALVRGALSHKWEVGAHLIIASLGPNAQLFSALRRAVALATPELVRALLPFSTPVLICDCLSTAARNGWWDKVPVLATALQSPARMAVVVKLLGDARHRPAVDTLLAFLPEQDQRALLRAHPNLGQLPNGAACRQRQHLERAIPQASPPSELPGNPQRRM